MAKLPGLKDSFSGHVQINQVEKELQDALKRISELENLYEGSNSQLVPLEQIVRDPAQVRKYFKPETISGLSESIKKHGILEPLIVRPMPDGSYNLVAGERRYRAAQQVGLKALPVTIREMDDTEAVELSLVENLQREDLNPVEQTEGILQLLSSLLEQPQSEVVTLLYRMSNEHKGKVTHNVVGNSEAGLIEEIFRRIASMEWQSFVAHRLPLLKLPHDILEALRQGRIEYTKARAIAQVKHEDTRRILLNDAMRGDLSLAQIKQQVQDLKPSPKAHLKTRFKDVAGKILKTPASNWEDPKKTQKITKLLEQLESLVAGT